VDANASSSLTPEQIWALCDELTQAHARYLPESLGGNLSIS
jgi:alpha-galactosidase